MKKFSLYIMALLSLGVVSCDKDFDPEVGPQTYPQENKLQINDITISSAGLPNNINIASYVNAETIEGSLIPIGVMTVNEDNFPANTLLKAKVQFSDENGKSIEVDGNVVKDEENGTYTITVNPNDLQSAYYNGITRNPGPANLYVGTKLFAVTNETATACIGNPDIEVFDVHPITLTPIDNDGKVLSNAYYIVGTTNDWGTTAETAIAIPFVHESEVDVYDDPVFTVTLDAAYNEDGDRIDTWFSILPGNDIDIYLNGTTDVLLGSANGDGAEATEGSLVSSRDFGGENRIKMPAEDGASQYMITINVFEGTYEISPIVPGFIYDSEPTLYLTGSNYGWNTWVPLVKVHAIFDWNTMIPDPAYENMSWCIIYLHEGEEFKFAPQAGWGNDFGMSAEITDEAGMNPSGDNNIVVGNSGWYLIVVNNMPEKRTVKFLKPNIYLIGNTSPASWNVDDSGLFEIPTEEKGKFVSPAFIADDEVRMAVHFDDGLDWWRTEFVVIGGQIDFRCDGGDQQRIRVKTGQRCYLNFSTGGGYYK